LEIQRAHRNCVAPTTYTTSSLETNLHSITAVKFTTTVQSATTSLWKQHGIQHFKLIHHCWAPSVIERIAPSTQQSL